MFGARIRLTPSQYTLVAFIAIALLGRAPNLAAQQVPAKKDNLADVSKHFKQLVPLSIWGKRLQFDEQYWISAADEVDVVALCDELIEKNVQRGMPRSFAVRSVKRLEDQWDSMPAVHKIFEVFRNRTGSNSGGYSKSNEQLVLRAQGNDLSVIFRNNSGSHHRSVAIEEGTGQGRRLHIDDDPANAFRLVYFGPTVTTVMVLDENSSKLIYVDENGMDSQSWESYDAMVKEQPGALNKIAKQLAVFGIQFPSL